MILINYLVIIWLWYTNTGNWCFKDGVITFQDIFGLYTYIYIWIASEENTSLVPRPTRKLKVGLVTQLDFCVPSKECGAGVGMKLEVV